MLFRERLLLNTVGVRIKFAIASEVFFISSATDTNFTYKVMEVLLVVKKGYNFTCHVSGACHSFGNTLYPL